MKVTLAGKEYEASPLNLRIIRRLMDSGKFNKLSEFSALSDGEQLDVMVAFIAASLGVEEDVVWDSVGLAEFNRLPQVFNDIMGASNFKQEPAGPNVSSP